MRSSGSIPLAHRAEPLPPEDETEHETQARTTKSAGNATPVCCGLATRSNAMVPEQIRLVQSSFPAVLAIREVAAALFYRRLFEIDPTTRPLFSGSDMSKQGAKLMAALGLVVGALNRFETLRPTIREL